MEIITTTTSEIPGKKIKKILGVVKGNTIRARHIGRDIGAGLKTIVGGEIKSYTQMTTQAREEAFNRMINEAVDLTGLFIDNGPVVQVKDSRGRINVEWDNKNGVIYNGPLAVIINRFSASASEIFF